MCEDMLYLRRCWIWVVSQCGMGYARDVRGELSLSVQQMARKARRPAPDFVHRSDRGVVTVRAYRAALKAHGMPATGGRKGDCYDVSGRTLLLDAGVRAGHDWHARDETRQANFRYIETWRNRQGRHSTR